MSDLDKAIRDKLNLTSPDHPRSWNELAYAKALTAVLDLHAHRVPDGWHRTDGSPLWWCDGCKSIVLHRSNACDTKRAIAAALGVSGEDRSEPTPAPQRQWAVEHPQVSLCAHNSEWSVLYTLSKLPGGRIVTRSAPDQPWTPETACLCVTVPDTGHYAGCPGTSAAVTPEGPA